MTVSHISCRLKVRGAESINVWAAWLYVLTAHCFPEQIKEYYNVINMSQTRKHLFLAFLFGAEYDPLKDEWDSPAT